MSDNLRYIAEEFNATLREYLKPMHATDVKIAEFIGKYISCRNVLQAAKACGLSPQDGRYLFNQPDIHKCITVLTEKDIVKFGYDAAEVVERTKEIAFFDPVALVKPDGTYIKNMNEIPPEARRSLKEMIVKNVFEEDINGVPQYKGEIISYKFWDKTRGLELLGREKDTFKKTTVVQHDVSKNAREYLLASLHRGAEARKELGEPVTTIDVTPLDIVETPRIVIPRPPGVRV